MSISNYLETKLLEHCLRNISFTSPVTVYVSLHIADPTDAGSGTEVSGGGYARVAAIFGAASSPGGTISNSVDVIFPLATGSWGTITYFGIWDALSAGNLLLSGILSGSVSPITNDVVKFLTGQLTVTLD